MDFQETADRVGVVEIQRVVRNVTSTERRETFVAHCDACRRFVSMFGAARDQPEGLVSLDAARDAAQCHLAPFGDGHAVAGVLGHLTTEQRDTALREVLRQMTEPDLIELMKYGTSLIFLCDECSQPLDQIQSLICSTCEAHEREHD